MILLRDGETITGDRLHALVGILDSVATGVTVRINGCFVRLEIAHVETWRDGNDTIENHD
jgi:hypothetical protein